MFKSYLSISKYTLVSMFTALVDWICFTFLILVNINPTISQGIARIIGGIFSFFSNRHWTFEVEKFGKITKQGARFLILYILSYILGVGGVYILTQKLQLPVYLSKILADSLCFFFNFLIMKIYVFKK